MTNSGGYPMSVTAMVMIKAQPVRSAALAAELAEVSGVSEVFSVAGRVPNL